MPAKRGSSEAPQHPSPIDDPNRVPEVGSPTLKPAESHTAAFRGMSGVVHVGPLDYRITRDQTYGNQLKAETGQPDMFGHTDHETGTMWVAPQLVDRVAADTMLHEILHCCLHVSGANAIGHEPDDEEGFVSALTTVLYGVLRDNPDLVGFLLTAGDPQ